MFEVNEGGSSTSFRKKRSTSGGADMGDGDVVVLTPLSETDKELCSQVVVKFADEDYRTCLELLRELLTSRPEDYRIKNNLNVVNFHLTGSTDTERFYTELQNVIVDANINLKKLGEDDIKHPIILYNLAVLYYHHKHYNDASVIVSAISAALSNFIDGFSKRVKLLHIDLLLRIQQFDKAMTEIEQFESHLYSNSSHTLTSEHTPSQSNMFHSPSPSPTPSTSHLSTPETEEDKNFENSVKRRLQQYKTLCCLSLRSLKAAKREYKQLFSLEGSTTTSSKQSNMVEIYIKGYYEYLRGNFKKASKIISNVLSTEENWKFFFENGDNLEMINFNNVGCCHFNELRPTVAAVFFQKATFSAESDQVKDKRVLPLHAKGFDRKYEIMYNFGISLLHAKHYQEAFVALVSTLKTFYNNPRLLLRVAECCVQINNDSSEIASECSSFEAQQMRLVETLLGNRDELGCTKPNTNKEEDIAQSMREISPLVPVPTLSFASECIDKALKLIECESVEAEGVLLVEPSNPITNYSEICHLHSSILCNGAYIELCLNNPAKAHKYLQDMFNLGKGNIPGIYIYLGNMYLAEIYLNNEGGSGGGRAFEALCSDPTFDISVHVPASAGGSGGAGEDSSKESEPEIPWVKPTLLIEKSPRDEQTARIFNLYNRAHVLAKCGEISKSASIIKELLGASERGVALPNDFINLFAYVNYNLEHGIRKIERSGSTRSSPYN